MLSRIREFIDTCLAPGEKPARTRHGRHLAAAALLIEVARADYRQDPREQVALGAALREAFGLEQGEIDTLMALAEAEAHEATSAYAFTRVVNDEFSEAEKSELVRAMWQVACADGDIDRYEEHLIRKIAALIYVPHAEFIRTKHEALAARDAQ